MEISHRKSIKIMSKLPLGEAWQSPEEAEHIQNHPEQAAQSLPQLLLTSARLRLAAAPGHTMMCAAGTPSKGKI